MAERKVREKYWLYPSVTWPQPLCILIPLYPVCLVSKCQKFSSCFTGLTRRSLALYSIKALWRVCLQHAFCSGWAVASCVPILSMTVISRSYFPHKDTLRLQLMLSFERSWPWKGHAEHPAAVQGKGRKKAISFCICTSSWRILNIYFGPMENVNTFPRCRSH